MSYNWHQKRVLDEELPLPHRYSHLRSCALSLARLIGQGRSFVIAAVHERTGVNIERAGDENELIRALAGLNEIRTLQLSRSDRAMATSDA